MEQSVDDDCSIINVLDLAAPPSGQTVGQPSTAVDSRTSTARRVCKSMTLDEADVVTARKRFAEMTANSRHRWSGDSSNCHENGNHRWPDDVSNATAEDGSRRCPDDVSNATAEDGSRRWPDDNCNVAAEDGRDHGSSAAEYGPYRWSDDFNADYRRYRWSDEFNPKSTDSTEASTVDFDAVTSVSVDAPATLTAHLEPSSAVQFTNAHTAGVRPNTRLVGASAMLAAASAFTFAPAELHGALNENDFGHPPPPCDGAESANRTQRDNNKDGSSMWTRSKECVTNCFVNAIRRMCFCEW